MTRATSHAVKPATVGAYNRALDRLIAWRDATGLSVWVVIDPSNPERAVIARIAFRTDKRGVRMVAGIATGEKLGMMATDAPAGMRHIETCLLDGLELAGHDLTVKRVRITYTPRGDTVPWQNQLRDAGFIVERAF